jgi:hypothetical protein
MFARPGELGYLAQRLRIELPLVEKKRTSAFSHKEGEKSSRWGRL